MNHFLKKKKKRLLCTTEGRFHFSVELLYRVPGRTLHRWFSVPPLIYNAGFTVEPSKRVKGQTFIKVSTKNPLNLLPLKAYDKNLHCAVSINNYMQREWAKCCYEIRGIHLHVHTQTDDHTPADVVVCVCVLCLHVALSACLTEFLWKYEFDVSEPDHQISKNNFI